MRIAFLTADLPGVSGLLKATPEDFVVEEIPAYAPSGDGPHLYLTVEKRGISTQEMVRRIARAIGVPPTAIGVAGQKDQQAITRQLVSVPAPPTPDGVQRAANLRLEGLTVLSAARHRNKLRTGHLRGNRFIVTIRGVVPDAEARARAIVDRLATTWLPNFYGAQRFGRGDANFADGRALLRGERPVHDRFKRRFLISAFQSALFNQYLAARMDEGALHRCIEGEVLQRAQTGGLFVCEPAEVLASQVRLEHREIVPTGPMFGHKMMQPLAGSPAAARERAVLEAEGITEEHFARFSKIAEGTRRPLLARIESPSVQAIEDGLVVSFSLPSGAYATVMLGELMKPPAPLRMDGPPRAAATATATGPEPGIQARAGEPLADSPGGDAPDDEPAEADEGPGSD